MSNRIFSDNVTMSDLPCMNCKISPGSSLLYLLLLFLLSRPQSGDGREGLLQRSVIWKLFIFSNQNLSILWLLSMGFIARIFSNGTTFMNTDFSIKLSQQPLSLNTVRILRTLQGFVIPVERPRPACAGCSRSCRPTREGGGGAVLTVTVTPPRVRLGVRPGDGTVSPQGCRRTGWSSQPSPTATRRLWVLTPRWEPSVCIPTN